MGKQSPFMKALVRIMIRPLFSIVSIFVPFLYVGKPERAGNILAELALGKIVPPAGKLYASLVRGKLEFPDPSALALDNQVSDLLWKQSAEMVDLTA